MSMLLLSAMKKKGIVKDGLVLWLEGKDFTNSPPTSQLRDRSGLGNNATPNGMAYTVASGSDNNGGIVLDGVDDYISVNSTLAPFGSGDFTVEMSLKSLVNSVEKNIAGRRLDGSHDFYLSFISNTQFRSRINGTLLDILVDVNMLAKNHIVFVKTSTYTRIYVNGIQVGQSVGTIGSIGDNNATLLTIGCLANTATPIAGTNWNGEIYGVRAYSKALTDAEILQNYNASK